MIQALSLLLNHRGAHAEAESLLREALASYRALGQLDPAEADILRQLATVVAREGRISREAEGLLREAAGIDRRVYGEASRYLAVDLHNLAGLLSARGAFDEAEPVFLEAIAICRKVGREGQDARLVGHLREGLEMRRRAFHAGDWRAQAENALGAWLAASGRLVEAEPLLTQTTRELQAALGDEHTVTRRALRQLAGLAHARGAAGHSARR